MHSVSQAFIRSSCAVVLIAGMSACASKEKEAEPTVPVQVTTAKIGAIQRTIHSDAVLFPIQQASITPKITAPVSQFYVNRGSVVKKGQLLAKLEDRDLQASAAENEGALQQAEATYANTITGGIPEEMQKAELDAQTAKLALEAQQKLFESRENLYRQGALPRKDLDQSRVSLTEARSQYDIAQKHLAAMQANGKQQELKAAEGQLQSARGRYAGARAQLSYTEIRSPIDGVIAERPLYPGEIATSGVPLFMIMNTAKIIAKAHVPTQDAALLKVGDAAQITSSSNGANIPARITVVSPATDPNSTTVEVWAVASNPKNILRPGTTAQLSVIARKIKDAVLVPSTALLNQPDGSKAVMVVTPDSHAHLQAVMVGVQSGEQVQIASGIRAGQVVVINGSYGVPDNTKVTIERPAADPKDQTAISD